jgi:uncharacterized protein
MHPAIQSTIAFVKQDMVWICTAHDRYHIERVRKNAQKIYASEHQGDLLVIELWALLHEAFDDKFFNQEQMHDRKLYLANFLDSLNLTSEQISWVLFCMEHVGFGKAMEREPNIVLPIEMQIVEDADRLDAIGAIAIARTFSYQWSKGTAIYDPDIPHRTEITRETYRQNSSTGINHFYEKLLLLKDLMHTKTGKTLATQRHTYMEGFLKQFFAEWNGEI